MPLQMNCIMLNKYDESTGTANVKMIDDDDTVLFLNRFVIDLTDGSNPVSVLKAEGAPVYSGSIIDCIKNEILALFQEDLSDRKPGMYKVSKDGIEQVS